MDSQRNRQEQYAFAGYFTVALDCRCGCVRVCMCVRVSVLMCVCLRACMCLC